MIKISGYQVIDKISENDRKVIYRGKRADNLPVILKVLRDEYPTVEEITSLRQEYVNLQDISFSGIVKVYSLEKYQKSFALVLEDFGGQSLLQFLNSNKLQLKEFLRIGISLANTLEYLHQVPIAHKDIKPSNIIIHPRTGEVKLTDFCIASRLERENQAASNPNLLEGTLAYMSPEQTGRMNRSLDYRTDFYSLGVTFYQMLTGNLPFPTSDPMELVHCHLAKVPVFPAAAKIPAAIADIALKLMAKNPEHRYQSAAGLKFDLETCLRQLEAGKLERFTLGKRDRTPKLLIPQKLYGREHEVGKLLEAFGRASQGAAELLLITGYSGIGKTSIVNEVQKPIVATRGYFIRGKFDQFQRNSPYAGIISAFSQLIRQLLIESSSQIALWREHLLQALGNNAQVMIDVMPELEHIIGSQPPVTELEPSAAQNRFNRVFQQFVSVFCQPEHPLAIFLDDLQWADNASFKLIQLLMDGDRQYLLLIGAYRDNEVSPVHPLIQRLDQIRAAGTVIETITVQPLAKQHVQQLVQETLTGSPEQSVIELATLLFNKSGGNPFFLVQLLKTLYAEDLLVYQVDTDNWQWDLEEILAVGITDCSIVELVARNLNKLPHSTQEVVKIAACIGNQFNLEILALATGQSKLVVANQLWAALKAGLILPQSNDYKIPLAFAPSEADYRIQDVKVDYRFLHDRVQQAAYSLLEERDRKLTHFKIGQLLLQNTAPQEREEHIFALVNQLNFGTDLLQTDSEKHDLAQLNFLAGQKAKAATAYDAAANYLNIGLELLGDRWQQQYELTLTFYLEVAEAESLRNQSERAKSLCDLALEQANTLLDQVKCYELKLKIYRSEYSFQAALELGKLVLTQLSVSLLEAPPKKLSFEQYERLPEINDPYQLAALRILITISPPAFIVNSPLALPIVFAMIGICQQYGNSVPAIYAYSTYGLLLCGPLADIDSGYQFGNLALKLLEKFAAKKLRGKIYSSYGACIQPWKESARKTLEILEESVSYGLEVGDIEFACHGAIFYCEHSFFVGEELDIVAQRQAQYLDEIRKYQQEFHQLYLSIGAQTVANLLDQSQDRCQLTGKFVDEAQTLPYLLETQNIQSIFSFYCAKVRLCYLFKEYDQCLENAKLASNYAGSVGAMMAYGEYIFYYSLGILAQYRRNPLTAQAHEQIKQNQEKMRRWAHHAPMNYAHKCALVEAETAWVLGEDKAIDDYEQAIIGARTQNYRQDEALAQELAGEYYLNLGKENLGRFFIIESYYSYIRWGATAKVRDLESRYPQFFVHLSTRSSSQTWSDRTTISTSDRLLDFPTIMKASLAISSEIVFAQLLDKLIEILIENAGAQKGLLLLEKDGELIVEACGIVIQDSVNVFNRESIPPANRQFPRPLIRYVHRTRNSVVINEARQEKLIDSDYTATNQPKSILCLPIVYQGRFIGILYLENNLTTNAFHPHRVEVLKLLSAQAAIALENALLYASLEEKVAERTQELEAKNWQLRQQMQERQEAQAALAQANRKLQHLATVDGLTGVANRRHFDEYLQQEYSHLRQSPLSLILFDVDYFKRYNDTYGHQAGDDCLRAIAQATRRAARRSTDLVARYGGEEFAVILPETNSQAALHVARSIRLQIQQLQIPHATSSVSQYITLSIGVATIVTAQGSVESLINLADLALYNAKQKRDRIHVLSKQ